ncbi:MAG: hypothetical protein ACOVNV_07640, partial [Pirellulaceae bacterium]
MPGRLEKDELPGVGDPPTRSPGAEGVKKIGAFGADEVASARSEVPGAGKPKEPPSVCGEPPGMIPAGRVPLGMVPLGMVPLGMVPLGLAPLGMVPLGMVPLGRLAVWTICQLPREEPAPLGSAGKVP